MPDLELSKLPELGGLGLQAEDVLAIADLSASETKKITAKNLIQAGAALIDDGSIPGSKVDFDITGSIGTDQLADGAVTTEKLADGAVTDDKISDVDGSKLIDGSVPAQKLGLVTDRGLDQSSGNIGHTNDVLPESHAGISWDEHGHITSTLDVVPREDLPLATDTEVGVVSVPAAGGLGVSGTGEIGHLNNPGANIVANINYDDHGHITQVSEIQPEHLPIATDSTLGAVYIPSGFQLSVDGTGALKHSESGVVPGVYPKVTVNAYGHVTSGGQLTADDIPNISADKLVGGEITSDLLAECSVTGPKICDYATCLMQEDHPGPGDFLGQLWYTPSTAQLRVYSRGSGPENIWLPVGFGALQANNLRWGGTIDAADGRLAILTAVALSSGLTSGDLIPPPSDELSGMYFITQVEGNNVPQPNVETQTFTPGDWLLCVSEQQGYVHIDAGAAGGGGSNVNYLNDLIDVYIKGGPSSNPNPFAPLPGIDIADRQLLQYDSTDSRWKNVDTLDGGEF